MVHIFMQVVYLASWTVTGQCHTPYEKKDTTTANFHIQKEAMTSNLRT